MLNKIYKIIFVTSFVTMSFLGLTEPVLAVDVFLFSANKELTSDGTVVTLGLDTGSEKINAISGELSVVGQLEVSNANSVIPLWVEAPVVKDGTVSFSGIIPGGFSGTGRIISLVFSAPVNPASVVQIKKITILRNDGSGQAAETKIIIPSTFLTQALDLPTSDDKTLPETFTPLLSKNDKLLDNQSYLIFNTTDKGSGVVKYFVSESTDKSDFNWQEATSPYLLQDQTLGSYVFVKAVDRAGNELVVELPRGEKFYQFWWFWFIIIISALGVCWWWRKKY